jgi:microcystin-dependent protein
MALETGDYPSDLVSTNPEGTDNVSQGDDHLRLIKHVIKTTFPNIDGPVTATQDELNAGGAVTGSITAYGGIVAPANYLLCEGQAVDRTTYADLYAVIGDLYGAGDGSTTFNVPDLQDRTIAGSSATNVDGSTAGAETIVQTEAQMPSHKHDLRLTFYNNNADLGSTTPGSDDVPQSYKTPTEDSISTGGGEPMDIRQPTVYMKYIIRT